LRPSRSYLRIVNGGWAAVQITHSLIGGITAPLWFRRVRYIHGGGASLSDPPSKLPELSKLWFPDYLASHRFFLAFILGKGSKLQLKSLLFIE
jgi:hypothetical protein